MKEEEIKAKIECIEKVQEWLRAGNTPNYGQWTALEIEGMKINMFFQSPGDLRHLSFTPYRGVKLRVVL